MTLTPERKIRKQVSIKWQTVFVFIPILNLYALNRVGKFGLGLGLHGLLLLIMIAGLTVVQPSDDLYLGMNFVWFSGYVIAFVYFIRRWSIQWNDKAVKDLEEL